MGGYSKDLDKLKNKSLSTMMNIDSIYLEIVGESMGFSIRCIFCGISYLNVNEIDQVSRLRWLN